MEKLCYHCDLPLKTNKYTIFFKNKTYMMCCPGCLAVFQFIVNSGLENYYKNREKSGNKIDFNNVENSNILNIFDEKKISKKFIISKNENINNINLSIEGISCSACTWLIERHLTNVQGVNKVHVNLSTSRVNVEWNSKEISLSDILYEFQRIGYKAYPYNLNDQEKINEKEYKTGLKNIIISGLGMMQIMMLSFALYMGEFNDIRFSFWTFIRWMSFIIATPVLFISGKQIIINALRSMKNKNLSMDFTISLSLILAYTASIKNLIYNTGHIYFDSICMFIFFLLIARFLEMRTRHHTSIVINSLQELTSGIARKLFKKKINYVPLEEIKTNDIILVQPNEIIPLDGIIKKGYSNIDESMITGEFNPVCKFQNSDVIGGTTNLTHKLKIKITNTLEHSKINHIINLLATVDSEKSLDKFIINIVAKYFIIGVLILTTIVTLIWYKLGNQNIIDIVLSMLVVTCPCALSLAVPAALTTSMNTLSKTGFMISKENIFENLTKTTDIVFDKTGTLTINKYFIKNIKLFRNTSIKKIITIINKFEKDYNHPISKAFTNINKNFLYKIKINKKVAIKNYISKGIKGKFNKNLYKFGNVNFIKNNLKNNLTFINNLNAFIVVLSDKKGLLAYFNLINPLRINSETCISNFIKLNIKIHLLTGDNSNKVSYVVRKLNIKNYQKGCSVEDKIKYIENLQANNAFVIMVGDGINDAPALKASNVSIAMGSGTDLAKINSNALLLNNNLNNIYNAIKHSFITLKIIKQNIFWAILYNFIGLSIAALGIITPYYAAIGMSLSSLIVVLNSLRLGKI